jgi:hypothetical protein
LAASLAYSETDSAESTRHLQTAVVIRPNEPNTLYNAACTYGVLKKKQEERETLREAFAAGYGNRNWAAKDSDRAIACGKARSDQALGSVGTTSRFALVSSTLGASQRNRNVAAIAPTSCAVTNGGTSTGRIPVNVSESDRAIVTAGFANDVDEVNQYAAVM